MIIKTGLVKIFHASAITVWPFILVDPELTKYPGTMSRILAHEQIHCEQQKRWAIWGLGVGLILWHLLYLLVLPCGWNWWRRRWETEAMREADGWGDEYIDKVLSEAPYYLFWRKHA